MSKIRSICNYILCQIFALATVALVDIPIVAYFKTDLPSYLILAAAIALAFGLFMLLNHRLSKPSIIVKIVLLLLAFCSLSVILWASDTVVSLKAKQGDRP